MSRTSLKIRALHVASGDLWAGAEVQLFTLLSQFARGTAVEPRAVLLNDGELARRLRAENVPVTVFDESKLGAGAIVRRLARLMREVQPDVVHTHRMKENVLGSMANLLATRAPGVRTCHGAPEHKPKGLANPRRLFYSLDVFAARHLQQKTIAVSSKLGQELAPLFGSDRIVVIPNGVDVERLRAERHPARLRDEAPDATHVGIVGRLEKVKRVDLFLEMAAVLTKSASERRWRFHVIGAGSQDAALKQQAAALGIADVTTFHGHRPDSANCLAALDVLVMCSDHEGLPMTPLESIAVGTPVVAHDVGGLSEILAQGAGGRLTSDHTALGYATAVRALMNDGKEGVLSKGYDRVVREYSAVTNATRTAELYSSLRRS